MLRLWSKPTLPIEIYRIAKFAFVLLGTENVVVDPPNAVRLLVEIFMDSGPRAHDLFSHFTLEGRCRRRKD